MIDPATALAFSMFENRGVYALLLGSGVSRAAEIPTGWEITLSLTQRLGVLEGAGDQVDWEQWHRGRFGEPPNYSTLLDALAQTGDERRAILHRLIEPTAEDLEQGRKTPTAAHRAIARLVRDGYVRVIITTNFDRLLETALRELGVEPVVIKSDDDLKGAAPLIHTRCLILKVHGDYLDTRLRNTEAELAGYSKAMDRYLDRIFDEHGLIVCGWSGDWDHALRAAITRSPSRRYPLYWAARKEAAAGTPASDLVASRGGRFLPIESADRFFSGLADALEVQATMQRPNPLSVDLLVATAKRHLARPEDRIRLADLLAGELARARKLADATEFAADSPLNPATFAERINRYQAISEPLVRLLFVAGRWGRGDELSLAADALKQFGIRVLREGVTVWLSLQTYPGVLYFYAYGLGLLKAGRFTELLQWFRLPLREEHDRERKVAVERLFLWAWTGNDEDRWKSLPGLERHRTPLSDHLHGLLTQELASEYVSERDATVAFEFFETLASLAFVGHRYELLELQAQMAGSHGGRHDFAWVPVGRVAWDSGPREIIFENLASGETRDTLLAAGFGRGDGEMLDASIANMQRAFTHISWY